MGDVIGFDFSGLNSLAADLGHVPDTAGPLIFKALQVTSLKIKRDWQESAKEHRGAGHAKKYPYSIDFDLSNNGEGGGPANKLESVIGPNLSKGQGALGILEETPGGVRGAPQGNARRALRQNLADFERGVLNAAADAFGKPRPL